MYLSKIVVVVKDPIPTIGGTVEGTQRKTYENAHAVNNDRGELVIMPDIAETNYNTVSCGNISITGSTYGIYSTEEAKPTGPLAVFKEWIYWERIA